jgi:c-di-GMP-binding flagellar brake protein YcgR
MESAEKAEELATGQQNRRAAPRQAVDEDARLLLVEPGCTLSCRLVDISLGGCRLRTKERFTAGAMVPVEVAFKVRGLAFRFSGITRWTDGRHLVGIRFAGVSARRREDLVEALSEVEAENAAKAAQQAAEKLALEEQPTALEHEGAVKSVEPATQRHPLTLVPAPEMAAHRVAEKLIALKGHDFSRAVDATEQLRALAPEGCFSLTPADSRSFSAACLAPESASSSHDRIAPRERRVQAREEVDTSAVIFLVNIASRLQGRILDLSLGGCRIRADERFPVGIYTRVETEFRLEGLPFRLGGVVQAIHDRRTVGIRFLDMSSRKREQVAQLIEDIREMKEKGPGTRGLGE